MDLKLYNTEAGRYLLGIKDSYPIVKITSNSVHQLLGFNGKKPVLRATFWTDNHVDNVFNPIFEKQLIASDKYLDRILQDKYKSFLHFSGLEKSNYLPQIYLTTITPSADSGGRGRIRVTDATFATAHDATTGTLDGTGEVDYTLSGSYTLARYFIPFDTSAIGTGGTITAGGNFVRLAGTGKNDGDTETINIVASTQASSTALDAGDYDLSGNTSFASKTIANYNAAGNNDFTLDVPGDGQISKTSFTKFAVKTTRDINNTAPTGSNYIQFTTTSTILSVTYTLAVGGDENAYWL